MQSVAHWPTGEKYAEWLLFANSTVVYCCWHRPRSIGSCCNGQVVLTCVEWQRVSVSPLHVASVSLQRHFCFNGQTWRGKPHVVDGGQATTGMVLRGSFWPARSRGLRQTPASGSHLGPWGDGCLITTPSSCWLLHPELCESLYILNIHNMFAISGDMVMQPSCFCRLFCCCRCPV